MQTDPILVTVFLNPAQCEEFKLFQQHYDMFIKMKENRIFDIGYGKCILNFAHNELQNIIKEEVAWRR